jgi:hypothetical protein
VPARETKAIRWVKALRVVWLWVVTRLKVKNTAARYLIGEQGTDNEIQRI